MARHHFLLLPLLEPGSRTEVSYAAPQRCAHIGVSHPAILERIADWVSLIVGLVTNVSFLVRPEARLKAAFLQLSFIMATHWLKNISSAFCGIRIPTRLQSFFSMNTPWGVSLYLDGLFFFAPVCDFSFWQT